MQCLSQLITKEQTHLSKIWDTVQTCREENAILLVWSQDKYYFNSNYLVHAISCRRISLFVMFIIFFSFFVPHFFFFFLFLTAWQFVTRHPPPATRHPSPAEKSCRNQRLACENSRFSSLLTAADFSRGGTSSAAKSEEKRLFRRLIKGKCLLFILKKKGKI